MGLNQAMNSSVEMLKHLSNIWHLTKPKFVQSGTAGGASGKKEQNLEQLQTKSCSWKGIAMVTKLS